MENTWNKEELSYYADRFQECRAKGMGRQASRNRAEKLTNQMIQNAKGE